MAAQGEATEGPATEQEIMIQLQQFVDEWTFRILSSSVGKAWSRKRAMTLLLDVFEMVGMTFSPEERQIVANSIDASDEDLLTTIVGAMAEDLRAKWEIVALQLQTVLHEATRIRHAAEATNEDEVVDLFNESGSDRGGLSQQVLKACVIYAASDVSSKRRVHVSWRKSTDARIDRLMGAAEEAEHCQQQLLALEAQLLSLHGDSKAKNKGVLMSMAEGQTTALIHSVFSSWIGYVEKCQSEKEIRGRFQKQIDDVDKKLFQFKEAKIASIKGVLMRGVMEDKEVLMHMVWKFWLDEVAEHKAEGDNAAAVKAVQDKLNSFEQSQRENAGKFMTRMASGNDESLKNLCLESWIKHHQDYAMNREMEEKVKEAEKNFKAHMDAKKEEAQLVMNRMLAGTDHGLLSMIIQNWVAWIKEEKEGKESQEALFASQAKFKSLQMGHRQNAHGVQSRVNEQIAMNLCLRIYSAWLIEAKSNRVANHYNIKYESKKRQLLGVQNLFKSFAMQLEQNLGQDDDSSSRSYRRNKKNVVEGRSEARRSKGAEGAEGIVSLPAI